MSRKHEERLKRQEEKKKTQETERASSKPKKKSNALKYVLFLAVIAMAGYGGFTVFSAPPSGAVAGAPEGSHWHADYKIFMCGELQSAFPVSPGGVHTHGDGKIHIHPHTFLEAGTSANLGTFLSSTGTVFSSEQILDKKNGDLCNGQPGKVRLLVNNAENDQFEKYAVQEDDNIEIRFE